MPGILAWSTICPTMKNDALKNIFLYALLAGCAFLLRGGCSPDKSQETVYVPRFDTITQWMLPETPYQLQELIMGNPEIKTWLQVAFQKVVYRHDTIHDQVIVTSPILVDTPVIILLADREWTEDVRLFEGEVNGAKGNCVFKYLAGVQYDSLQFISIEGDCQHKTQVLTVEIPPVVPLSLLKSVSAAPTLQIGAKVGWSPRFKGMSYGVQSTWKGLYGATNYLPGEKSWMFEAGVLIPVAREQRQKEFLNTLNRQQVE